MFIKKQKAQATLEYVLVITAVVGLLLYAAANWMGGNSGAMSKYLNNASTTMEQAADKLP